jgi:hypothetical protein
MKGISTSGIGIANHSLLNHQSKEVLMKNLFVLLSIIVSLTNVAAVSAQESPSKQILPIKGSIEANYINTAAVEVIAGGVFLAELGAVCGVTTISGVTTVASAVFETIPMGVFLGPLIITEFASVAPKLAIAAYFYITGAVPLGVVGGAKGKQPNDLNYSLYDAVVGGALAAVTQTVVNTGQTIYDGRPLSVHGKFTENSYYVTRFFDRLTKRGGKACGEVFIDGVNKVIVSAQKMSSEEKR